MARVLLLTDLHIGRPGMDAAGSDYSKSKIVPAAHQRLRHDVLADTTSAMASAGLVPDALVIAGDVTYKDAEDGWKRLPEVLKPLRDAGLASDRIVVTPGNHDVTRNLAVDDPAHYARFLAAMEPEWVTPLLDGHDFDDHGQPTTTERKYLLMADERLVIVPINSSHYCGVREPFEWLADAEHDEIAEVLKGHGREDLANVLDALKVRVERFAERDPIRISPNQLRALTSLSATIDADAQSNDVPPSELTRVAVMHHPTLPVTVSEEFAPFESLSNLALVRLFLAGSGFHVLLHGHRHAGTAYMDRISRFGQDANRREDPLLVVSGSTLSGEQGQTQAATLLNIDTRPLRRAVRLTFVPPAALPPSLPDRLPSATYRLWEVEMRDTSPLVLSGQTAAETYQRVLAAFPGDDDVRRNLMCIVERPDNASRIPPGYPSNLPSKTPEDRQQWFSATVQWWQRTNSKLLETLHFTHGERLKGYPAADKTINQIADAVAALQAKDTSTRAVLTLTDPPRDQIATKRGFPAFVVLHALLRTDGSGTALDVLGVFRKQEMRYWWPINVAEMAAIQDELLEALKQPDVRPGRLITLTSLAHVGSEVPAVNVALVDRLADEDRDSTKIWVMAYGLAHPQEAPAAAELWEAVLDDLTPSPTATRATVPIIGLTELLAWLDRLGDNDNIGPVKDAVTALSKNLEKIAGDELDEFWRTTLVDRVAEVRAAVQSALSVHPMSDTAPIVSDAPPNSEDAA